MKPFKSPTFALFMNTSFPHLLLASKSPRRQFLLREAGFDFTLIDIDIEENFPDHLMAEEIPLYLSRKKSEGYAGQLADNILVTADTIVWLNGGVLNKPENIDDARRMLRALSGNSHTVYTAVCMRNTTNTYSFAEATKVYFKALSEEEITYYLDHFRPLDKAGAYGIQEWIGYIGIEKIEGCYYNVMGFPVSRFYEELNKFTH